MELIMFSMYFTTIIHVCLNGSLVSTCHHLLTCLALSNMAKAWILNCCLGCTWFLVKKDNLKGFFLLELAHGAASAPPLELESQALSIQRTLWVIPPTLHHPSFHTPVERRSSATHLIFSWLMDLSSELFATLGVS